MIDLDKIKPGDTLECSWEFTQVESTGVTHVIYLGSLVKVEMIRYVTSPISGIRDCYITIEAGPLSVETHSDNIQKYFREYAAPIRIPQSISHADVTVSITHPEKVPYEIDLDYEDYDYHGDR